MVAKPVRIVGASTLLVVGASLVALSAPAEPTAEGTRIGDLRPAEVAHGEALDTVDYADPFVLRDGEQYYAFATNGNGANVQVAVASEFSAWRRLPDALPQLPNWGLRGATWAPTVLKRKSGYVLFFTVRERASGFQCISRAVASSPQGPYTDSSDRPLICQTSGVDALCGSIDPSPFVDEDGTAYLYWKSDENSPACRTSPRIWVQQLTEDGLALKGTARPILNTDQPWEAPIVEGPAMVRSGQEYFLFYSANWYASDAYAVGYAQCRSAVGPCQKVSTTSPWLRSHGNRLGPGGQEFFSDARGQLYIAYHAWLAPSTTYERGGIRALHIEPVAFLGSVPKLVSRTF